MRAKGAQVRDQAVGEVLCLVQLATAEDVFQVAALAIIPRGSLIGCERNLRDVLAGSGGVSLREDKRR
jgi:hypothetical protein